MGGREYRGIRTKRYTYVRDLNGPWLLFDNDADPYQQKNLINKPSAASIQSKLDKTLVRKLNNNNDDFLPEMEYIKKFNYPVDAKLTVPHQN
jgi:arylsulfatase A-like enzyme